LGTVVFNPGVKLVADVAEWFAAADFIAALRFPSEVLEVSELARICAVGCLVEEDTGETDILFCVCGPVGVGLDVLFNVGAGPRALSCLQNTQKTSS
jgi:hypothetical protein